MNVQLPERMLAEDGLQRWGDNLGASDAQFEFMRLKYQQFVKRHNEFMEREMPGYLGLASDLNLIRAEKGISSEAFVEASKELDRARRRVLRRLEAIEQDLIDSFETILALEQAERLPILRHDAARRHCRIFDTYVRWANVDLRQVWDQSTAEFASPAEAMVVEVLLVDYDARVTNLICRLADIRLNQRNRLRENHMARLRGEVTPEEGRARYEQIMRRSANAAIRIRELNQQTVSQIVDLLCDEIAAIFVSAARQAVFPDLYPDATALHDFLEAMSADDKIDIEARREVAAIADEYVIRDQQLCVDLEAFCIDWGDRNAEGINGYQLQFLPDALAPLLEKRTELSRNTLQRLQEVIGREMLQQYSELIPQSLGLADAAAP